ncbi:MAG: hypothetical protein ACFFD5_08640 [Candidatus Thorarchaeota archaeon]
MSNYKNILNNIPKIVYISAILVIGFTVVYFNFQGEPEICSTQMGTYTCRPITPEDREISFIICIIPIAFGLIVIATYLLRIVLRHSNAKQKNT